MKTILKENGLLIAAILVALGIIIFDISCVIKDDKRLEESYEDGKKYCETAVIDEVGEQEYCDNMNNYKHNPPFYDIFSYVAILGHLASYTDNGFSTSTSTYYLSSTDTAYYCTYASSYTYNTTTDTYKLVSPTTAKYSNCYTSLRGKYVVDYYGTTSSSGYTYTNVSEIFKVTNATYGSSASPGVIKFNYLNTGRANYDSSLSELY